MEQTLQVEQNSGQQPYMSGEESQSIQQTRGSESFGVQTNQQDELSPQEQQELMNFLHTESAGPVYNDNSVQNGGVDAGMIGLILLFVVISVGLLLVYYRLFTKALRKIT